MVRAYLDEFRARAAAQGITALSFYLEEQEGRSVSVYQGACDKMEIYSQTLLFIEGEYGGFCGSVFVENFDRSAIDAQIALLKETAETWQKPYLPREYPTLPETEENFVFQSRSVLLEKLRAAEQAAFAQDSRVATMILCGCREDKKRITLLDQDGRSVSDCWGRGQFRMDLTARSGDEVQRGSGSKPFETGLDFTAAAVSAAQKAVTKLGATSYPTSRVPTLLDGSVLCQMLDAFMPIFFAKNIQSHMSVLDGRAGQKIAGDNIRLYEDPAYPGGLPRRFDDEGVLCREKSLIDAGRFAACLYNRSSARAAGTVSGGNGFKASFSDEVGTAYTNIVLAPGAFSREELLTMLGDGLYIDDISGINGGANPVSGDFSLIAKGYRVEGGKLGRGVKLITIAGNFFELLSHTRALGAATESLSGPRGFVFCPDLLAESLMISGNE